MTKYYPIGSFIVKVEWHHRQLKLIQEDEKATRKKESGLKRTFKGKREEGESRTVQRFETQPIHACLVFISETQCVSECVILIKMLKYLFSQVSKNKSTPSCCWFHQIVIFDQM